MGSHGVFTYKTAHAMGILSPELARWVKAGRIVKVGHGDLRVLTADDESVVGMLIFDAAGAPRACQHARINLSVQSSTKSDAAAARERESQSHKYEIIGLTFRLTFMRLIPVDSKRVF